jgi:hypothetical protein
MLNNQNFLMMTLQNSALVYNLYDILPTVQTAIDREFYYCYGDGRIQVEITGINLVYVVRG